MRKMKFTEVEVTNVLNEAKNGLAIPDICLKMGITNATFYHWKKSNGLKNLEEKNQKLHQRIDEPILKAHFPRIKKSKRKKPTITEPRIKPGDEKDLLELLADILVEMVMSEADSDSLKLKKQI
jgi:putative transposase